jgi:hypothetical protein
VVENETDRAGNTLFLSKGLQPLALAVPWDEVKLIDVGLEQYNNADYVVVASSSLGKALVVLEIDNMSHSGSSTLYTPEAEAAKNDGHFKVDRQGYDRTLLLRVNPSGEYVDGAGAKANVDKKARWLVARDWMACFLGHGFGAWSWGDCTLVFLYYDSTSALLDERAASHDTVVAYGPPALPVPRPQELADWACCVDPYLLVKGSALAQEHLALAGRVAQPVRE